MRGFFFDTFARNPYANSMIDFNAKKNLRESRAAALAGLQQIASLAHQAAQDLSSGELTQTPMELLMAFAEQIKPLEQFREDEQLALDS